MLKGKKIILGITGSIAAYKSALIVRLLVKQGAEVRIVMTPSACGFITPLTLSTLSGNKVFTELSEQDSWANHVMMGRWADLLLIAPASANTIAKLANGICDNLLTAVYLSAICPVMFAPAMDEDMWQHPAVRSNVERLKAFGHIQLPVGTGELASGLSGEGRMAEPEMIVTLVEQLLDSGGKPLKGKRALVTAGPTYEPLDPVRFIGNNSSGKMGMAIAEELAARGAQVELILGPSNLSTMTPAVHITPVRSAEEMHEACIQKFNQADIAVMAAAVADYRPKTVNVQKIKKSDNPITVELEKTADILEEMGRIKSPLQILVGFSLETDHEKKFALQKLSDKNLDMIVLNSLKDPGAGFGDDTNKITIFKKGGQELPFPLKSKTEVAMDIVTAIIDLYHERQAS